MRRLFLSTIFLFAISCALLSAQNCKIDAMNLKAKVRLDPTSVHALLGEAISSNPDCIGALLEVAIVAAKPNDDTLTQLIRMAVSQYPTANGAIAEAALMASPEQADVIRQAFSVPEEVIVASPVELPEETASIEELPIDQPAPQPDEPKDIADRALLVIDALLLKMKDNEEIDESQRNRIVASPTTQPTEEIRPSLPDHHIEVSTLGTIYRDVSEELLQQPEAPLVFSDPTEPPPTSQLAQTLPHVNRKAKVTPAMAEKCEIITSSVYRIPPASP